MKLFPKTSGWVGGLFAVAFCLLSLSAAKAQLLWYNGDSDGVDNIFATDSLASQGYSGIAYEQFTVTAAGGWQVNGVFGNFVLPPSAATTAANWTILSGVSLGNGGKVVASGNASPLTLNALSSVPDIYGNVLYQVSVTGLNFNLAAGTYWLGLQPISTGYGYLATTSGGNSVGATAGNAYYTETSLGDIPVDGTTRFESTTTVYPDLVNFSVGITGTAVPEPSSSTLAVVGLGLLGVYLRKRLARA
jgi:hypothetical protein